MRDDSHRWDVCPGHSERIVTLDAEFAFARVERQVLVSGSRVFKNLDFPIVTWPDVVTGQNYALSIRRDRVLIVNGPKVEDGWDDAHELAFSDVSDAYTAFDLTGPEAFSVVRRGTEISTGLPSRSVARLFFGLGAFLYQFGREGHFRIHVSRAQSPALWKTMQEVLQE